MEVILTEQLLANVIGGEERASASTETLPVQAPATGEVPLSASRSQPLQ